MKISRFNESLLIKRFQEFKAEITGDNKAAKKRVDDPRSLLTQCGAEGRFCRV
jgi:hypothetical protein